MYRLFLALRYLRSRLVNLISVCGVMAGVAVLIVVTCVMDGFQAKVRAVLRGDLSDLIMVPKAPTPPPYDRIAREIQDENPGVAATSPQVSFQVLFPYKTNERNAFRFGEDETALIMSAVGIDWEKEIGASDLGSRIVAAHDPEDPFAHRTATELELDTLILGKTFAEKYLGLGKMEGRLLPQDMLGGTLGLVFVEIVEMPSAAVGNGGGSRGPRYEAVPSTVNFVVSAVYESEDTSVDVDRVYVRRPVLRKYAHIRDEYHEIRVRLKDPEAGDATKARFNARYATEFDTQTWEDQRRTYLRAVANEKVLLVIVLSFIVLLGGFIILATLTLTVVEKTKDIGVLAALGAHRKGILSLFLWNGFLIGVIGALLGVGLGWLFVEHVNDVKDGLERIGIQIFPPDIYLFREIPTVWSWPTVAWIVTGSVAIAFFAGLLPAMRASRMDPIRALRYE